MKKGVLPLKVIVMLAILMVFVVLFIIAFLTPKGLLNSAAENSDQLLNYLPTSNVDVPNQQIEKDPVFTAKYNSMLSILQNADGPCVVEFDWPKEFNKYTYEFSREGDKTLFTLRSNGAVISDTLVKVQMCVVAGEITNQEIKAGPVNIIGVPDASGKVKPSNVLLLRDIWSGHLQLDENTIDDAAHLFYLNWIEDPPKPGIDNARSSKQRYLTPDYTITNKLVIGKEGKMELNSKEVDRDDGNLLYVPGKEKVCFFRTFAGDPWVCNAAVSGLDNDCIEEIKLDSC
jgi:hypothetical protein